MIDPQLKEATVLITGANHGTGAASARAFAAQGAKVSLAYYRVPTGFSTDQLERARRTGVAGDALYRERQQTRGEAIADEIRASGGRAFAHEADLEATANIGALFDQCEEALGPVDVLVLNHAHCAEETFDPVHDRLPIVSGAGIDRHHVVNVRASTLMIAEFAKRSLAADASLWSAPMRPMPMWPTSAMRPASTPSSPTRGLPQRSWAGMRSASTS